MPKVGRLKRPGANGPPLQVETDFPKDMKDALSVFVKKRP
jgi:hypothetical protein